MELVSVLEWVGPSGIGTACSQSCISILETVRIKLYVSHIISSSSEELHLDLIYITHLYQQKVINNTTKREARNDTLNNHSTTILGRWRPKIIMQSYRQPCCIYVLLIKDTFLFASLFSKLCIGCIIDLVLM